jgi:moderate conductance mechanosensitive channel
MTMGDLYGRSTAAWLAQLRLMGTAAAAAAAKLCVILFLYWWGRWLMLRAVDRLLPSLLSRAHPAAQVRESRVRTIGSLLKSIGQYVLLFIAGVMALRALDLEVAPVIAGAGVFGLAVGFGAQKVVKDVITGLLILVEDQFDVGETVTIAANTGVVEEIGMRITRIRDDAGKLIILSNGDISTVVNHSRGPLSVAVDVSVAPDTGLERLRELVAALPLPEETWAEPPSVKGVVAMDATKLTVRIAGRAEPGRQSAAELGLRQALREALAAAGVKLG